jgi:hypothetical protein
MRSADTYLLSSFALPVLLARCDVTVAHCKQITIFPIDFSVQIIILVLDVVVVF